MPPELISPGSPPWPSFAVAESAPKRATSLDAALASNAQVLAYLLGRQPLPRHRPTPMGRGYASEAIAVAAVNLKAWRATPGALDWLATHINTWFM
jgi:hypothetical protein